MALPEKITAWKDATEPFGGWHETQAGQGASGDERFYIRADLVDELVKALGPFVALGNRILSEAPQEAARLAVFTDHEGETHSLEFADLRACPQPEIRAHFIALASPANVKALDAYTTRLREDLDRVTRERDGAYLTSQQAAQSYSNLMRAKDDIDAQRQAAEAALAVVTRERDEALMRADPDLIEWAALARKSKARAEAAEAALAKRDEEVARLREAARLAERAMDDCGDLRGAPAHEALIEALTKEPPHAG